MTEQMSGSALAVRDETREALAIDALLTGVTIKAAADEAGISERTLRRWLQRPAFYGQLARARRERLNAAASQLAGLTDTAVEVAKQLLDDPDTPAAVRRGLVGDVLNHAARLAEAADVGELTERLERLEKRLGLVPSEEAS